VCGGNFSFDRIDWNRIRGQMQVKSMNFLGLSIQDSIPDGGKWTDTRVQDAEALLAVAIPQHREAVPIAGRNVVGEDPRVLALVAIRVDERVAVDHGPTPARCTAGQGDHLTQDELRSPRGESTIGPGVRNPAPGAEIRHPERRPQPCAA